jgi:hypothetical protein
MTRESVMASPSRVAALLVGVCCAWTPRAGAQLPLAGDPAVAVGTAYETYQFLDPAAIGVEEVSLLTLAIAARVTVTDRIGLELRSAYARAVASRPDDSETTLSGPTDTEVRANVTVVPERLTVSLATLLPTGNASQTLEEAEVAGLIAADLIPFRISNWGAGGAVGMITTLTYPVGGFSVGASVGYTVEREFEPFEDRELAYRPGDELRLRLAIDRSFGSAAKASLVLGGQWYQREETERAGPFQPGDRLEALGSLAFAAGPVASGSVYAGIQHRGTGRRGDVDLEVPAQDLIQAGGGLRIPTVTMTVVPSVDVRVIRRSDGQGQGHLSSAGASLEVPLGGATLVPTLRGRFGKVLLWEGEETDLRGGEIGVGLRIGL